MRVIKLSLVVAVFTSLAAAQAFADDGVGAFHGTYVSLGGGVEHSRVYDEIVSAPGLGLTYAQPDAHGTSEVGQILAGYSVNLCSKFNLAANIFHDFGNQQVSDISSTFYHDNVTQKFTNNFGVSFEPGYYINKSTLAYVKLGYVRADLEYDRTAFGVALNQQTEGLLTGLGVKHMLNQHIFIGADVSEYDYGKKTDNANLGAIPVIVSPKTEQTVALVSVGYQF